MRGSLSEDELKKIEKLIPQIGTKAFLAASHGAGVDINDLIEGTNFGIALVCLEDAIQRFSQVRMALHETFACLIWYREVSPKSPNETSAVFLGKFYLDYLTLLLYAIGEDIAAFIIAFLNVDQDFKEYLNTSETQNKFKEKRISSNAGKVGIFLNDKFPNHEITKIILELHKNQDWRKAIKYRNVWVHEQPPIIAGLGIHYDRKSRVIKKGGAGLEISFGGGSPAQVSIDEFLEISHRASTVLAEILSKLSEIVITKRTELGENFDFDSNTISIEFFE